ncbi:uncharacterized protein B0H18DRAFT_968049 [Fomitopsis serialis]|uniref:uncharacterized protein n=1 Tax=Fomitopsis serialis TaxID=139415 RepID=UPI0020077F4C|nr:uncharacterized protein B0H18DRAFT_968049 [Neoantrodia serialis]KAH9938625.1 hypothetical protein B0H18DRAFT_968049 [Neoantrodia serialis]
MERFLAPQSPEALAHNQLNENWFSWDIEHPSLNETLIAGCATYEAFKRYLSGSDLYLLPRTRTELENISKRYAYDTIHNAIAKARSPLERGGYSRVCCESSSAVLAIMANVCHVCRCVTFWTCTTRRGTLWSTWARHRLQGPSKSSEQPPGLPYPTISLCSGSMGLPSLVSHDRYRTAAVYNACTQNPAPVPV